MSEVLKAIEQRSSTRGYTEEKLTEEELDNLIRAALQAPTAANTQEIHITVVEGSHPILKEIEELKNLERGIQDPQHNFYFEAPTVLLLSAEKSFSWRFVDAGIAVENIALAAEGMGLGSLIIGCIKDALTGDKKDYFSQKLRFPEGYEFVIAIAVGHKAVTKEPHQYNMKKNVSYL
ncbi:MAG: nitroreductase family protein [Acetatifactor sp.]|nr:nitroreductase family protein [Acetatifactor sp.]